MRFQSEFKWDPELVMYLAMYHVMCSHMLLADLGYVVTSFCDLDCRMDCPMPCNNNISNIYGLNWDITRKWLFVKKRMKWNCTFAWETYFQTVVCRSSDPGVHCRLWGKRKQYDYHCRGKRHLYKVLYFHSRICRGLNRRRLKISDWEFGTACPPWQRESAAFFSFDTICMVQQFGQTIW